MRKKIWMVIILILLIIIILLSRNSVLKSIYPKKYSEYVEKYSKEYDVDENLIYAMIKAESNFKNEAQSHKSAKGLMQLMDSTAKDVAKSLKIDSENIDLFDPETNIMLGTKYISTLIKKYENIEIAVVAYNAGIGNVDMWIEQEKINADGSNIDNVPYKESNNYVRKILNFYKTYKEIYK